MYSIAHADDLSGPMVYFQQQKSKRSSDEPRKVISKKIFRGFLMFFEKTYFLIRKNFKQNFYYFKRSDFKNS